MLYLDNSATTKVLPEVYNEMIPYISEYFGNPNSKYYNQAVKSQKAVDDARNKVASFLNCKPDEIIFTSGSTESNNFVLKGFSHANKEKGNHIIVSSLEHSSIINTALFLQENGYEVTFLTPEKDGTIDPETVKKSIRKNTILVSIMWANNELGSINDIKKISKICHDNGIVFHTDATQYAGKGLIDLQDNINIDFLSLSAHKFYGPKGIGIIFVRKDKNGFYPKITPLLHGGEQEFGLRSGTLAVHQIVGLGKASEIAQKDLNKNIELLTEYEEQFKKKMIRIFGDKIVINNDFKNKIPGLISIRIKGYNNQLFLKNASSIISASTGSACSNSKPSYVLKECGYSDEEIRETIRFSLSAYENYNNFDEIE